MRLLARIARLLMASTLALALTASQGNSQEKEDETDDEDIGDWSGPLFVNAFDEIKRVLSQEGLPVMDLPSEKSGAIALSVTFEFGSAELPPETTTILDAIGTALLNGGLKDAGLVIVGHSDAVGTAGANQVLSERRAEAVRQYLIQRYGFDPDQIVARGKGESELLDPGKPASSVNRRAEITPIQP